MQWVMLAAAENVVQKIISVSAMRAARQLKSVAIPVALTARVALEENAARPVRSAEIPVVQMGPVVTGPAVQKDKPAVTAVFAVIPSLLHAVNAKSKELTQTVALLASVIAQELVKFVKTEHVLIT